jgi:hypothetical protein
MFSCLLLIAASCSTYKELSFSTLGKYNVTLNERLKLHYVLKKHDLLYTDNDRRVRINNFGSGSTLLHDSRNLLIQDNVLIPKGAAGVCISSSEDVLVLDFGEGVLVPFKLGLEENRASGIIEVDNREYRLQPAKRNPSLYFNRRRVE